jgi:hypothetical protein
MGGVNFTRNRAWWHTAIWDEYGQRHQYLCILPTMAFLIPLYWYGTFINRELEQNFAAKMYQLDYENKRNRLTHNMIMEHFETHVEKVQEILDEVKIDGFEKAFEYEIKHPGSELMPEPLLENFNDDILAEIDEYSGLTAFVDQVKEHFDLPYWIRQEMDTHIKRRKYPHAPYKYIDKVSLELVDNLHHVYYDPWSPFAQRLNHRKIDENYVISEKNLH